MGGVGETVVFTFWAMFFTVLSVKEFFLDREGKDPVLERLDKLVRFEGAQTESSKRLLVSDAANRFDSARQLRAKLLLAGLKRQSDVEKYLLFQRLCFSTPFFVFITTYFFLRFSFQTAMLVGVLLGVVFMTIPRLWLIRSILKRRKEIKRHLPDALDLFIIALEAGLSFDSALVRVGEEQRRISTHISREFIYTNQQILVGKSREEALRDLAKRCGLEEMDSLVRTVLQSNKLGTSLVRTLRTQAGSLRKKRRQDVHAQIIKTPVKLIFPLLFFVFPTLVMLILGPSLIQIFRFLKVSGGS